MPVDLLLRGGAVVTEGGVRRADVTVAGETISGIVEPGEELQARRVVDVSGLDFCDSMGVGVLVTAHGRATERGGWVRLASPSGFLRRLFDTLGLSDYLPMFADVPAALTEE